MVGVVFIGVIVKEKCYVVCIMYVVVYFFILVDEKWFIYLNRLIKKK